MNAEFQIIARRDERAFLSYLMINARKQKKATEWERLDLFKKIRDAKGIFHAGMGSIKDRNGMDLKEAENIKKNRRTVQKRSS